MTVAPPLARTAPPDAFTAEPAAAAPAPPAELTRGFFLQLSVIGSTMGTRNELERLIRFCLERDIKPVVHATMALADAREGFEAMLGGEIVGKVVFRT